MRTQKINLCASAGDGKLTVLKPRGEGCAYIVDLGTSDAALDTHCNDVCLEITSDATAIIHYADKSMQNIPYWIVENTTLAQMEKFGQIQAIRDKCADPDVVNKVKTVGDMDVGEVFRIGLFAVTINMTILAALFISDKLMFFTFLLTMIFAIWMGGGIKVFRAIQNAPVASFKLYVISLAFSGFVVMVHLLSSGQAIA